MGSKASVEKIDIPQDIEAARLNLLEEAKTASPELNLETINKAFYSAYRAHITQYRASGEHYIFHPIAVAKILIELKLDTASIVTGLLHDTIEDTPKTYEDIEQEFGKKIADLVEGVTKLTRIEHQAEHIKQAENFRKLVLAISKDIRVLLVKLADRLHNMRTLHHIKKPEKRMRIAHETMEIYSRLAERLGIHMIKNELQDLAFAAMHPDIRQSILTRLNFLRHNGQSLVDTIVEEIKKTIAEYGIKGEVTGREKTSCSIWRKMQGKNVPFEQLSDIVAFRIIVDTVQDCYHALGAIHSKYHMIPHEFKDYISTPKANGYQSLHTIVMGPEKRFIEIQIRTRQMHEIAELGFAAHWAYKQGMDAKTEGTQFKWVRELLAILKNTSTPEEFLENTRLEMYYDQVFCFTPQGDLIALPRNATPIDFAFAIHSKVGLTCMGARVNGKIVPLRSHLENGDQVEIIRSSKPMVSSNWEDFVVTGKARSEVKRFLKQQQKDEYLSLGRTLLAKAFQQKEMEYNDKLLTSVLGQFKKKTVEDLIAAVGEGVISRQDIVNALSPEAKTQRARRNLNPLAFLRKYTRRSSKPIEELPTGKDSLRIKGLVPGIALHFAKCCHPIPGDKIVGLVNTGKGITIHTIDCNTLTSFSNNPEKWIEVAWEDSGDKLYVGSIRMVLVNEYGSLAETLKAIASNEININNINIVNKSTDFFELLLDIEVKGVKQLNTIISNLRGLKSVHTVERART